jgi:hypothetical protein
VVAAYWRRKAREDRRPLNIVVFTNGNVVADYWREDAERDTIDQVFLGNLRW